MSSPESLITWLPVFGARKVQMKAGKSEYTELFLGKADRVGT